MILITEVKFEYMTATATCSWMIILPNILEVKLPYSSSQHAMIHTCKPYEKQHRS